MVQRGRCTSYSYLYLLWRDAEVGTVGVDTDVVGVAGGVGGEEVAGAEALTLDAVDGRPEFQYEKLGAEEADAVEQVYHRNSLSCLRRE